MSDYTGSATQSLSLGQSVAGLVKIRGAQVMSLEIGFRFHRARGRLRAKTGAIVQSLSIGQVAGNGPGKTPTP